MTHYHLIGIGGTGLSAIARVLFERGETVTGSDMAASPGSEELMQIGIKVFIGHEKHNINGAKTVIRSSAIQDSNPEVIAALEAGIPVLKRRDFLSELTGKQKVIAVAGTHGKTTTTAMIAWCLKSSGFDPSFVIGSNSKNLESNAAYGKGDYFVIEADEYDNMFLGLEPDILVVTNIEHDHPDCFPTKDAYLNAFKQLLKNVKSGGYLIACQDNEGVRNLLCECNHVVTCITYGIREKSDLQIKSIHYAQDAGIRFSVHDNTQKLLPASSEQISLQLPGEHNALNATAALAVAAIVHADFSKTSEALSVFAGTGRRFDIIGQVNGITIIDDYGHHPTEIKATLAGARSLFAGKKIWTVWQPHTYSRTKELFGEFCGAFSDSDHVIVTEIYRSREQEQDYTAELVVKAMEHPDKYFLPQLQDAVDFLKDHLNSGDVLIVFSAGDANQITKNVLQYFQEKGRGND
jgi:UDP-N-acetylmuramate--alanine ligase